MNVTIRRARPEDADICRPICFEAFNAISSAHNFPPDFPSRDVALGLFVMLLSHPRVYAVVAEVDGRPVGSNMLWEDGALSSLGPITVDPTVQNSRVGRRLMETVLERARANENTSARAWCSPRFTAARSRSTRSLASLYASHCRTCRGRR